VPRLGNYAYRDLKRGIAKLPLDFREGKERNAWYTLDGRAMFPVQSPKVHSGNVPFGTINAIRQQLHLTTPQFQDLIACPLSAQEYEVLIREKIQKGTIRPA
jgi:hypothetical protein